VAGFDVRGLYAAVDAQRVERGLSWQGMADEIWELSEGLYARRDDHPISVSTLKLTDDRRQVGCHHALFMLRWLGKAPEDFVEGADHVELPEPGPDYRLRWDLSKLADAVDEARRAHGMTWAEAAERAHCTTNQLTGLKRVKFGTTMRLTMRLVRGLGRPSTDFIYAAQW
jgi:hypothetical protein